MDPQQATFLKRAAPVGSRAHTVLDDYVNGGESLWLNNYLRGLHMEDLPDGAKKELRKKSAVLNKLIYSAPVSRHRMLLFRAIAEDAPRFQNYNMGDDADFMNKGLISTSTSYESASTFLEEDESCCMLVILAPIGTHMLEILDNSVWSEEAEVLLPHGSRFKVQKTSRVDGIKTFYCILTSQNARAI